MASLSNDRNGLRRILFVDVDGSRKAIRLGKCSKRDAESIKGRVESLLATKQLGTRDPDMAIWLAGEGAALRPKLETAGLVEPLIVVEKKQAILLSEFLDGFVARNGPTKKPATRIVWGQVVKMLKLYMPPGILLTEVTKGHCRQFVERLKQRKLASTTIHKRVGFARQFFQDAVDWEHIPSNPFSKIRTQGTSAKSNVEVPRESIDRVLGHCDLTWQLIVRLSRFGGLRCPSEVLSLKWADIDWAGGRMSVYEPKVEHHEGRGVRLCPIFPELRPTLETAWDKAPEGAIYVVDKPGYREAANTPAGWANANLRTQFTKILTRAGIPKWNRLFHSMRASRQTELEAQFPRHVVCAWMGNSSAVAEKSYLLVTEEDFRVATSRPEKPSKKFPLIDLTGGAESGARSVKSGAKSGAARVGKEQHRAEENPGKTRGNVVFPSFSEVSRMEDNGLEPMTSCMPCTTANRINESSFQKPKLFQRLQIT